MCYFALIVYIQFLIILTLLKIILYLCDGARIKCLRMLLAEIFYILKNTS